MDPMRVRLPLAAYRRALGHLRSRVRATVLPSFPSIPPADFANHAIAAFPSSHVAPRNFSFSGSGFLVSYQLGIASALLDLGYLQANSRVAGASGGAIVALAVAANIDPALIHAEAVNLAVACQREGTWGKLEPRLRRIFKTQFGGVDVRSLKQRLTITTLELWPKRRAVHSSAFESPEDLYAALTASCWIPFYLARQAATKFRNEFHIDGSFAQLVPEIPEHVRVCAFPSKMLRRPDIELSPSLDEEFPYSIVQLANFSLSPQGPETLEMLFQLGRKSAVLWAQKQMEHPPHEQQVDAQASSGWVLEKVEGEKMQE